MKGEGTRGGHVVGHTKSGKPIYDHTHEVHASKSAFKKFHRDWTEEDHLDARNVFNEKFEASNKERNNLYNIGDAAGMKQAELAGDQAHKVMNRHDNAGTAMRVAKKMANAPAPRTVESFHKESPKLKDYLTDYMEKNPKGRYAVRAVKDKQGNKSMPETRKYYELAATQARDHNKPAYIVGTYYGPKVTLAHPGFNSKNFTEVHPDMTVRHFDFGARIDHESAGGSIRKSIGFDEAMGLPDL